MSFAASSPASASAQPSEVSSSSAVPLTRNALRVFAFCSGVFPQKSTVVSGVTFAGFVTSAGTSEISTRSGNGFPVLVSVPPLDTILATPPAGNVNDGNLK